MQRSKQYLYSMTSPARASSDVGAVTPIAFAVFMSMAYGTVAAKSERCFLVLANA
jgi:hypothetical protein